MTAHHLVDGPSKPRARGPPLPNLDEPKAHCPAQPGGSKVLVGNRIAPIVQQVEVVSQACEGRYVGPHPGPEINAEAAKVCPEATGLGIPTIQLAPAQQVRAKKTSQGRGRGEHVEDVLDAFRMKTRQNP